MANEQAFKAEFEKRNLRVLMVEDSESDVFLLKRHLERGGYGVVSEQVCTQQDLKTALERGGWDLVISDFSLPGFTGLDALAIYNAYGLDAPFLVVSGTIGEEAAIAAMKSGASDYILKDNLTRLIPAVDRELRDAEVRTTRKKALENLRQWETVFRHAGWGVALIDPRTLVFKTVNPSFARMHGYFEASMPELRYESLLDSESKDELPKILRAINDTGHHVFEAWHRTKEGRLFPVLTDLTAIKDVSGHVVVLAANFQDITVQKRTEQAMREANEKLSYLDQIRTEFTSMVSHELRTPLTAIKEGVSLVLDGVDGPVTEDQRETMQIIQDNVDRLARLINNVLSFEKIDSGRWEMRWETVDLCELIADMHAFMGMAAKKKGVIIQYEAAGCPIGVVCDPDKIKQVLVNLLDNAIKFTESGGAARITCRRDDRNARIEVKDTGPGIVPEEQTKIFEMFTQGTQRGEWKAGGAGIGLAICKRLVEQHNGDILVESVPGSGSTFIVSIPLDPVLAKARTASSV